ncbi:MAG: nucleoside triphosphate pyrophosphohydrolase [Turicibacter sp.]|nr:nucleoside triphosphate pyrophosphohydrolase [Turicibacter sp.]
MPVYNKLVRDNIPQIIEASGKVYTVKTVDKEAFKKMAVEKLSEEGLEFLGASTKEEKTADWLTCWN